MPDFFEGDPLPLGIFPPDTDEKKKYAAEWMPKRGDIGANVKKLNELAKETKEKYGGLEALGVYGLCWGGKVCSGLLLREMSNQGLKY